MARAQCHYDFNQVDTDCKSTYIYVSSTTVSYTDHNPFQHLLRLSSWGGEESSTFSGLYAGAVPIFQPAVTPNKPPGYGGVQWPRGPMTK